MEEKPKDDAGQKNDYCPVCGGPHDPGLCPEFKQQQYWLITYLKQADPPWHTDYMCESIDRHPADWIIENIGKNQTLMCAIQISQGQFERLGEAAAEKKATTNT